MDKEEEAEDPESIDRELHLIVRSEVEDALARPLESSAHEQDGWSTGAPLLPDDPIGALEMFARQLSDADSTTFEALRSEVGGRVGAKELRELLEEIYARRDKPDRRIRSETGYARAELRRRSRVSARIEAHR